MISPHTPPGTEIICVKAARTRRHGALALGAIYTVREIILAPSGDYGVALVEIINPVFEPYGLEYAYCLSQFRRLDLGRLDALLDVSEKEPAGAPA
jgi:hypothetical protein